MSRMRRVLVAWVMLCLLLPSGRETGFAQVDDELWSQPVNLSRSGTAESPLLVVGPEQQMQVFWWDRFDGLTTSYTLDNDWSDPISVPIQMIEIEGEGVSARVVTSTIFAMPYIVGVGETALALWLDAPNAETRLSPLLYSRLRLGTAEWTAPEVLAESAAAWEIAEDPQGVLHLVYCQAQQLEEFPAGIYYVRSIDGGITWSEQTVLYASLYVRLWTADTIHLSIAADAGGAVLVGWDDPRQESAFYVFSADDGASWSEPAAVQDGEIAGLHPRFIVLRASPSGGGQPGLVMLWEQEGSAASTCVLQQQRSEDGGRTWSAVSRVFEDLTSCPAQIATAQTTTGPVLLMRGAGAEYLLAAAWDGEQWSALKRLNFNFENPQTGTMVYLESLQADVILNNALLVVGQEQNGDIWMLEGRVDVMEWAFAAPSPWSSPATISEDGTAPDFPVVATDAEGVVHVMWSASPAAGQSGSVLYYSRWDEAFWSRPAVVQGSDEVATRAPALVFAEPFLHAVWSGGPIGTVFYSRAYPSDAFAASGWSAPTMFDEIAVGSSPALTADLLGRLHLVYAVPFNEGRGIYYTRTDDYGESWQETVQLFDAIAEGWPSVDRPAVAVDERGGIHVVWSRAPLPDYGLPRGVYYAQSTDHGETWTDAMLLADGPYDWPQVVGTLTGQVVVTWQDLTRNIVQYRDSGDYGLTWGYVSQVPGLQPIEGRAILVQDGTGRLHLTALDTQTGSGVMLRHLIYAGGQWSGLDSVVLEGVDTPVGGAVPAVVGASGLVDV
ncbi:MAG: exo-alpha-sialidase, partial [Anaerolineae bacterium]|nr:exo-alpha-sialidase [Anaerolineae bacterium]